MKKFITLLKKVTKTKKQRKEKVNKPRSYIARKMGVIVFWGLFIFMFLVVFVNVFSSPTASEEVEEESFDLNLTTQPEAIQFAIDFSRDYFTWDMDDMGNRQERLKKYLAKGMDENAGLAVAGIGWNSSFQGASLKRVDEISDDKSHIVLYVRPKMTREVEEKVEEKQLYKYFVVPVAYDGQSLGVYSEPYFTDVQDDTTVGISKDALVKGLKTPEDSGETSNIRNFLNTFFSSYAEDSPDKLAYILNDPSVVGLNGTMDFDKVNKSDVYQGEKDNQFIVYAEVTFEEPELDMSFDSSYYLLVSKENNRYVVEQVNAESYIEEMIGNTVSSNQESQDNQDEEMGEDH